MLVALYKNKKSTPTFSLILPTSIPGNTLTSKKPPRAQKVGPVERYTILYAPKEHSTSTPSKKNQDLVSNAIPTRPFARRGSSRAAKPLSSTREEVLFKDPIWRERYAGRNLNRSSFPFLSLLLTPPHVSISNFPIAYARSDLSFCHNGILYVVPVPS